MKKNLKKVLAIVMALIMVFAMSSAAFANTDAGSATLAIYIVEEDGTSTQVDSMTVDAGQSVYDALDALDHYEPQWDTGKDVYDGSVVQYLTSFVGYPSNVNVDHQYNSDGSGWSKDWGWLYTVNDVMPSFANNPDHGMAMNQYTIQNGDSIDVAYTLTETSWDANYTTTYSYLPWK